MPKTPGQIALSIFLNYVLPVLVVAGLLWLAYDWAYDRGKAACEAKAAAAAEKANASNEAATAEAGGQLTTGLQATLPAVEESAHASVERIRTVYVDRPVAAGCAWSGRVLEELEGGRAAANRAVRGGTGSADPAHPQVP